MPKPHATHLIKAAIGCDSHQGGAATLLGEVRDYPRFLPHCLAAALCARLTAWAFKYSSFIQRRGAESEPVADFSIRICV
jgi:hypothetical protein